MNNFDIIGALKTYADDNDMHFLCGSQWYQNYEASQNVYDNGQLVLACDFNCVPKYGNSGQVQSINYEGALAVGCKFDDDSTAASLDETFYQKYVNRLQSLMLEINTIITTFMCSHELTVASCRMSLDINKFDTNIDFVSCQITFVQ